MPKVITGNLNAPVMMMAEKISDRVLGVHRTAAVEGSVLPGRSRAGGSIAGRSDSTMTDSESALVTTFLANPGHLVLARVSPSSPVLPSSASDIEPTGHYRCRSDRHLGAADGAGGEAGEVEAPIGREVLAISARSALSRRAQGPAPSRDRTGRRRWSDLQVRSRRR